MNTTIARDKYDIIFSEDDDVVIMFDHIDDIPFKESAIINLKIREEEGFVVKIIKDNEHEIILEEFPLEAGAFIEDKIDIVITELNGDGDIAENYLASVKIGD